MKKKRVLYVVISILMIFIVPFPVNAATKNYTKYINRNMSVKTAARKLGCTYRYSSGGEDSIYYSSPKKGIAIEGSYSWGSNKKGFWELTALSKKVSICKIKKGMTYSKANSILKKNGWRKYTQLGPYSWGRIVVYRKGNYILRYSTKGKKINWIGYSPLGYRYK